MVILIKEVVIFGFALKEMLIVFVLVKILVLTLNMEEFVTFTLQKS